MLGSFTPRVHSPRWPARLRQQLQQGHFVTAIPVTERGHKGRLNISVLTRSVFQVPLLVLAVTVLTARVVLRAPAVGIAAFFYMDR